MQIGTKYILPLKIEAFYYIFDLTKYKNDKKNQLKNDFYEKSDFLHIRNYMNIM